MLLNITCDPHQPTLTLDFPPRLVSTNADQARQELLGAMENQAIVPSGWDQLRLNLRQTDFVDSIGLNLIFDLVKMAEARQAPIRAELGSRSVRLIFYTVRLDRRMQIDLIEGGAL
jgi:anti-anti-sigma regulatory factor